MPLSSTATTVISALRKVPAFAHGKVRDLRVRWALEEIDRPYRVELYEGTVPRPDEYRQWQPFGQVPAYADDEVRLFESGAILLHLGEQDERLLPREAQAKADATAWLIAALNSVEPSFINLLLIDVFFEGEEWARLRRPGAEDFVRLKLKRVSEWLGDKQWLEDRFTIGDLMMVTVLRFLRHTKLVAEFPNLADYQARAEARPAFKQALSDQLAVFAANQPQPEGAAA